MGSCQPTRRHVLKAATALLTVSVSARSLGLSASARVPEKIVVGTLPIPVIVSSIGDVDYFRDEALTIELSRFNNFAPVLQAMTTGSVVAGEFGVAGSIIGITRGLPLIAPFLAGFSTPGHPFERIMVLQDSPIKTLDDLKGKKLAFLGPGTVPDMFLGALAKRTKIRKEDIDLVPKPAPNMPDALAQGLVEAIFAIPPADRVAEQKYKARTVANATELVSYTELGTFAVKREFAEAHPEATKKLLRGVHTLQPLDRRQPGRRPQGDGGESRASRTAWRAIANTVVLAQRAAGNAERVASLRDAVAGQDDRS